MPNVLPQIHKVLWLDRSCLAQSLRTRFLPNYQLFDLTLGAARQMSDRQRIVGKPTSDSELAFVEDERIAVLVLGR